MGIFYGVPQRSVLEPLLFRIDLSDSFVIMGKHSITDYPDDNRTYVSGKNIDEIIKLLEESLDLIFRKFSDNHFQRNESKFYVLLIADQQVHVNIGTAQIKNSQQEKLLEVPTDTQLSFKTHIQQICEKAKAKSKALARIARS